MTSTVNIKRFFSVVLCAFMLAALTACGETAKKDDADTSQGTKVSFSLTVVDADGKETVREIETDEKTVGAALLKQGIIKGENGPYGLYIKTVNGITADFDTDGTYWAFYVNGEYALKGVDQTEITPDADYMLKIEK